MNHDSKYEFESGVSCPSSIKIRVMTHFNKHSGLDAIFHFGRLSINWVELGSRRSIDRHTILFAISAAGQRRHCAAPPHLKMYSAAKTVNFLYFNFFKKFLREVHLPPIHYNPVNFILLLLHPHTRKLSTHNRICHPLATHTGACGSEYGHIKITGVPRN